MTLIQQLLLTRTEPQVIHDPLTHPQVIHDLDRLLVLHRDVHRDVVVETGTHWELLRQGRPVVFPAWNRRERAAVKLAARDPEAFLPLLTSWRAQRLHLSLPAVQLGGLLLQLLLPLQQLGGSLRLLLRSETRVNARKQMQHLMQAQTPPPFSVAVSRREAPLWASWWRAACWRPALHFWASAPIRRDTKDIKDIKTLTEMMLGEESSSPSTHRLGICKGIILLQPRGSSLSGLCHWWILWKHGNK